MNLKNIIDNYEYNTFRKVIIGREEFVGMIIQKTNGSNVNFYRCNVYKSYEKYSVDEDMKLSYIESYSDDNEYFNILHGNCTNFKNDKIIDLRVKG